MSSDTFSRRNFIGTLAATGAAATAQAIPLSSFTHTNEPEKSRADRIIKIVTAQNLSAYEMEQIKAATKNIELHNAVPSDSEHFNDAEVVFGYINSSMLKRTKKLRWIQTWGAGVEGSPKELIDMPVTLTNMQRTFAPVIAESAIALLLSLTRGLVQYAIPNFNQRKWAHPPSPDNNLHDLEGKTIGIVGMGGIGSETARRLHYGFNMRVLATDAKPMPKPEFVEKLMDPGWLMEMVPQVDVLMSAAPLTKETNKIFNEQVFNKMKASAYFINVSRGGLVDQPALIKALKENKISGAGLDVATPEPLPADSELWSCPNLVISPHNSAYAQSRFPRMAALVAENVRRYSIGQPLLNVVDKVKGY